MSNINDVSDDINPDDVPEKDAAFYAALRGETVSSVLDGAGSGVNYDEMDDEPTDEFGDLIEDWGDNGEVDAPDETKSVSGLEAPAPLPDPYGVSFTDEELDALTDTESEEAVKLALGKSTPNKRALLSAGQLDAD